MFRREPVPHADGRPAIGPEAALSIVSGGVTVIGDIESNGILKIDGTIEGSVRGARQVLLGSAGRIHGDISAVEAIIAGTVHGSIFASVRLELQSSAIVDGDVDTKSIVVLEGARINGNVRMNDTQRNTASNPGVAVEGTDEANDVSALRLAN
jgi:cytoskeletal protein CcmA (bactofilin family)